MFKLQMQSSSGREVLKFSSQVALMPQDYSPHLEKWGLASLPSTSAKTAETSHKTGSPSYEHSSSQGHSLPGPLKPGSTRNMDSGSHSVPISSHWRQSMLERPGDGGCLLPRKSVSVALKLKFKDGFCSHCSPAPPGSNSCSSNTDEAKPSPTL